jgi:translation initiation factor IF-3
MHRAGRVNNFNRTTKVITNLDRTYATKVITNMNRTITINNLNRTTITNLNRTFATKVIDNFNQSNTKVINNMIKHPTLQILSPNGQKLGLKSLQDALQLFNPKTHQLVVVNEKLSPPLARIMELKTAVPKTVRKISEKEVQVNTSIDPHDLDTKLNKSKAFLQKGHRLTFNLTYNGIRHNSQVYDEICSKLEAFGKPLGIQSKGKKMQFKMDPLNSKIRKSQDPNKQ